MAKPPKATPAAAPADPGSVIAALMYLPQAAAAWLLGVNDRTLRGSTVPRNPDGSYNGADVVAWRVNRPRKVIALTDNQYELLLQAVDVLGEAISDVRDAIDRLTREMGPGDEVLGLIFRAALDDWDASHRLAPDAYPWGGAEIGAKAIRCEDCGKVRNGRRWRDVVVPKGTRVILDTCPACCRKRGETNPGRHDWPLYGDADCDNAQATETT